MEMETKASTTRTDGSLYGAGDNTANRQSGRLSHSRSRLFVLVAFDIAGFLFAFTLSALLAALASEIYLERSYPLIGSEKAQQLIVFYTLLVGAGLIWFTQKGHYSTRTPWWQQAEQIILFCFIALVLEGFLSFSLKIASPRLWVSLSWVMAVPCLFIMRWTARALLIKMGSWAIPTVLICGRKNGIETLYALRSESYLTYDIKYCVFLEQAPEAADNFQSVHGDIPVKDDIQDLCPGDYAIIAPDYREPGLLASYVGKMKEAGVRYAIIPPLEGFSLYGLKPRYFFGYGIVMLEPFRKLNSPFERFIKAAIDKTAALTALLLLSPLFIILSLIVKKDGGSAFYGQKRIGRDGKMFKCWKFRSMVPDAPEVLADILANDPQARAEWEADFKLKNDPRITKVGHFLRKTSLDEIPQLINVLHGEMSLVGPRPIVEDEKKYYGDKLQDYMSVKPGVTGLWQVSGRNDITYAQRVYLDSWYVHHWSVWTDIVIIIKTVFVIFGRKGAY